MDNALLERAERAFKGLPVTEVMQRVRAIIGPSAMPSTEQGQLAQQALDALRNMQRPTPMQLSALELVIRLMRPAPLSKAGMLEDVDEDIKPNFNHWPRFRELVAPYLYSVGRINLLPNEGVGTGFLVSDSLLVTNKHVLNQLSRGTGVLERGQAVVRFRFEYGSTDPGDLDADITGVEAIHETLDIALLRLSPQTMTSGRRVLELDDAPAAVGQQVAAVGYPFKDSRNPLFVPGIFGADRLGVKRAAVGEIVKVGAQSVYHDCSTLGGNSGSPLFAMETARVVGLHCEGFFLYRNEAVDGASLRDFVRQHV
jgi:S1-C subfamily serine protease